MSKFLISSLILIAGIIISGSAVIYYVEIGHEDAKIKSGLDATWWAVSTITTVGYGDLVPVTDLGKTISIVYMFSGISFLGIVGSILGTKLYKRRFESDQEQTEMEKTLIQKINDLEGKAANQERILKEILDKLNKS